MTPEDVMMQQTEQKISMQGLFCVYGKPDIIKCCHTDKRLVKKVYLKQSLVFLFVKGELKQEGVEMVKGVGQLNVR